MQFLNFLAMLSFNLRKGDLLNLIDHNLTHKMP